jgi:cytochrome c-type biogenesis protein CcmF
MDWRIWLGAVLGWWVITANLLALFDRGHGLRLKRPKANTRQWGMVVAHIGIGIVSIGVIFAGTQSLERSVRIDPGDHIQLGPYRFYLTDTHQIKGTNYHGEQADITVTDGHKVVAHLHPQLRLFEASGMTLPKTAITPGMFEDIYTALGRPVGQTGWTVRLYIKPFVRWIWGGGLLVILGGLLTVPGQIRQRRRPTC